jgi:glycosyltransferase involved in cell wall biosynthesis
MKKHIVIDARIISITTGRYVERLLHYLEEIDHINTYTILVKKKDEYYYTPKNKNFSIKVADFKNYSFNEQIGFLKLLNGLHADLVHFCQPEQPILYRGKKVTTIHDLTLLKTYNPDKNWFIYRFKQFIGRFVFKSVVQNSRYIITPTDFTKREILEQFDATDNKVVRIYHDAEMKTTKKEHFNLPSKKFLLSVGQQSEYKNIKRLAAAHQSLLRTNPDLLLVLVGKIDGPAQKNKIFFESKGYKNIIFTGFVSDEQLNWLFSEAQVFVFPSLMEGFGFPGLEAMLHGTPVASSNTTCLPEVYGNAALYFNPKDTDDIVEKINTIISNKEVRDDLVTKGNAQVKKYSWKRTAEQTLELYKNALKN